MLDPIRLVRMVSEMEGETWDDTNRHAPIPLVGMGKQMLRWAVSSRATNLLHHPHKADGVESGSAVPPRLRFNRTLVIMFWGRAFQVAGTHVFSVRDLKLASEAEA